MMKAKTLLGLVVLATVALWALAGGCVTEEEVEQAPTAAPTLWQSPRAPATGAITASPTRAPAPAPVGTARPIPSSTEPTLGAAVEPSVSLPDGPTPTPGSPASPTPKPGRAMVAPADFIHSAPDGKYFIPDGGDGCYYVKVWRA